MIIIMHSLIISWLQKRSGVGFSWFWNLFDEDCTAGSFAGDWVDVTKQSHWSPLFLWFPNSAPVKITGGSLQTASNYKSESSLATKTERTDVTDVSTADDVDCALVVFCHPGRSPQKTQKGVNRRKPPKDPQDFWNMTNKVDFLKWCSWHKCKSKHQMEWIPCFFPHVSSTLDFADPNQGDVLDAWPRLVNVSLMLSWNESPRRHGVPRRVLLSPKCFFFFLTSWKTGHVKLVFFFLVWFFIKILYCKQNIYTCRKNQ